MNAPRSWLLAPIVVAVVTAPGFTRPARADDADAGFVDRYVPVVPIGPSRTMHTTLVMPTTPWLLTDGEAGTPERGRVAFHLTRLSDERAYTDRPGNTWRFDGEEQVATLEVVSPRLCLDVLGSGQRFYVAGSVSAHTLGYAWFAGLRNVVEDVIGQADAGIKAAHDPYGRALTRSDAAGTTTDLLDSTPVLKARGAIKFPLRETTLLGRPLESAWSVGVSAPAFGGRSDSANASVQLDTTLAWAMPLSERWRLTGAFNVALPGASRTLDRFGVEHRALVGGGTLSAEWWPSPSFAVALGASVNGPYTRDGDAPTDLSSYYLHLGVLWRATDSAEVHLLFAENPGNLIVTRGTPSSRYSFFTQRDADFSITMGGSFDF